ncbi:hypothetical protein BGZ83_000158 [Gryganskiella cystojenkinii]|nr:hypothetical protein BGZ83_000158 [Gryganskiella cystojenkinii]
MSQDQDTEKEHEGEPKDPLTGLTATQTKALERAKQYAQQIQEELFKSGVLASVTEPEPSLAIANVSEQRKSLCRVYVGSISFEATEEDVRQKLGRFGAIKELVLKADPGTLKHRGFCFVEYELPEAAILAVQASDSVEVVGRHLKIGRPKNYDASAINELPPPPENRIYVANVGAPISESALKEIFESFGAVDQCVLLPDPVTRQHRGFGYVQYKTTTDIDALVEAMKGFKVLDQALGVCKAMIGGPLPEGMKALEHMPVLAPAVTSAVPGVHPSRAGMVPMGGAAPVNPALLARATATAASTAQRLVAQGQNSNAGQGDRESVASEENMSISGNQRYMVMQSLARSGGILPPAASTTSASILTNSVPSGLSAGGETTVVRLQYSATPADVDDQLEEEFKEECSKYGPVIRVQLLPLNPIEGLLRIFIQFVSPVDARSAAAQLNGRQFDGKTIQASLFDTQEFLAAPSRDRAPDSPNLSPIISQATLQELSQTPATLAPGTLSTLLLPHQYLCVIFPVTLVLGSIFGFLGGDRPSYFSNKRNILNMLFVKNGWGWTSIVFLVYLAVVFGKALIRQQSDLTQQIPVSRPQEEQRNDVTPTTAATSNRSRTRSHPDGQDATQSMVGTDLPPRGTRASARVPSDVIVKALVRWGLATLYWWLVSQWFFGPGLFDRVFVMTGGGCSVDGHWSQYHCRRQGGHWSGGVDISGHMFLLTHAWLFLMEELSVFLNVPESWTALENRQAARYAVFSVVAICGLWWWMLLMTSVYYHQLTEKLTGLFFGMLFWFASYVTTYKNLPFPSMPDQAVIL